MDQLTPGIISQLCTGEYQNQEFCVQVIAVKNVNGRYRLLLHDGIHQSSNAMLNSTYNEQVEDGRLANNSILRVGRCNVTESANSKYFAVLIEVEVIAQLDEKLGNPIKWEQGMGTYTAPASNGSSAPAPRNNNVKPPVQQQQQQQQPQQPQTSQRPKPANNNNNSLNASSIQSSINPISGLNPYQNKWAIKGRVIQKGDIRKWSNARGEGHLFSFEVQDESGSIKVTAFKDDCDRIIETVEEGKVVVISKGALKPKDSRYNKTSCQYELTVQRETIVEACEDDGNVPKVQFNFRSIADIETLDVGEIIDVVGVIRNCGEVSTMTSKKDNRELIKRDLQICDQSKKIINLTVWGQMANDFKSDAVVVAARQVRVGDFGGKSLSTIGGSKLYPDEADVDEINQLRGWWDSEGSRLEDLTSLSTGRSGSAGMGTNWKCFKQTTTENMGGGEKPDYYSVKANVVFTKKDNAMYQACNQENCNKKVQEQGSGTWRCEKCNKEIDAFKWRMMLQVNLADCTDNCWATLFQESGEVLMGVSAEEMGRLKEDNPTEYDNFFAEVNFKPFMFRMRAKMETYNDETRLKTTVVETKPFDPVSYGGVLSTQIDDLASKMGL